MQRRHGGDADPREQPAHTIAEVAHYLDVPAPTIRFWVIGRGKCPSLIDAPARHPVFVVPKPPGVPRPGGYSARARRLDAESLHGRRIPGAAHRPRPDATASPDER